jgi:hypothetical protein
MGVIGRNSIPTKRGIRKMALGTKLLVILLAISTVLTLSGYNDPDNITGQFGYDYNHTTDSLNTSNDKIKEGINTGAEQQGIIAGVTNFFDRYINVQGWVTKVFSFITAPVGVLQSIEGTPQSLVFMVGGIWGVLWAVAIASFIWRKDL